jgi:hypothetical protein
LVDLALYLLVSLAFDPTMLVFHPASFIQYLSAANLI